MELSYNKINDISAIDALKNLKNLDLRYNNIYEIDPVTELKKLEYLNLAANYFDNIHQGIGGLKNLIVLELMARVEPAVHISIPENLICVQEVHFLYSR